MRLLKDMLPEPSNFTWTPTAGKVGVKLNAWDSLKHDELSYSPRLSGHVLNCKRDIYALRGNAHRIIMVDHRVCGLDYRAISEIPRIGDYCAGRAEAAVGVEKEEVSDNDAHLAGCPVERGKGR